MQDQSEESLGGKVQVDDFLSPVFDPLSACQLVSVTEKARRKSVTERRQKYDIFTTIKPLLSKTIEIKNRTESTRIYPQLTKNELKYSQRTTSGIQEDPEKHSFISFEDRRRSLSNKGSFIKNSDKIGKLGLAKSTVKKHLVQEIDFGEIGGCIQKKNRVTRFDFFLMERCRQRQFKGNTKNIGKNFMKSLMQTESDRRRITNERREEHQNVSCYTNQQYKPVETYEHKIFALRSIPKKKFWHKQIKKQKQILPCSVFRNSQIDRSLHEVNSITGKKL